MSRPELRALQAGIERVCPDHAVGRVAAITGALVSISGLAETAAIGDAVEILKKDGSSLRGEILSMDDKNVEVLPDNNTIGVSPNDRVILHGPITIAPDTTWIGRVIDPLGAPLDGSALLPGENLRALHSLPPVSTDRRALGHRLETGNATFNTLLPLVRGQRIGLFSGSGVGKSTLLSTFAHGVEADVIIIALVGERGREVRHFVEQVLGPSGMKRAIVVAATSDQSPLSRRRCAWTAMTVAEYFRDSGKQVLLLVDSVTRFAEAHREVALNQGEKGSLQGYPPSMVHQIMSLAERAGPGTAQKGDITAIFSVLVSGSDMENPVADTLRGVLDGHVVLDRAIAERGRYPAIDLLRSVSRSLPQAASHDQNALISEVRKLLGAYQKSELMVQSGLYEPGIDPLLDRAIALWQPIEGFLATQQIETIADSFARLAHILKLPPDGL